MKAWIISGIMIGIVLFTHSSFAENQHISKYQGQETRAIKSLSQDDIFQLESGKGWGLAKAAELNGIPGPIHLLEMGKEIGLSEIQTTEITALYENMKSRSIPLGKKLIELESQLNDAFRRKTVNDAYLLDQLEKIANTRKQLRYVHLSAHLKTPHILNKEQIIQYNQLRGYQSNDDPCKQVPAGHDREMWLRHNGCQ